MKISKELWGKMNPSFDASATKMMSAQQESMEMVYLLEVSPQLSFLFLV